LILLFHFVFIYLIGSERIELKKIAVSSLPEDTIAPDLKSVTPDFNGNVFAFAGRSNREGCFIVKFDENLKYLKQFGMDGKGPGAFTTQFSSVEDRISVDINGDVYIADSNPRRLVVFDNDGNHKKDIMIDKDYSKAIPKIFKTKVVGDGVFIALQSKKELPPHALIFTLTPPAIKVRYPFIEKQTLDNYTCDYFGRNCIMDADSRHIIVGHSQIYKFRVYDRDGTLKAEVYDKERVIGKFNDREMAYIIDERFTPNSGNSQLLNTILSQLNANRSKFKKLLDEIKNNKNVIADIQISGERVYVFPVRSDVTVRDKYPVEIYNLKGQVIRKGYFKKRPAKIWKNYAFFYDTDEEDNPLILKYEILDRNFN